ncbi:MAG: peptide ABC transporter substrate-binding protein [Pseudobdellovibrionaceae bacterium]
MNFRHLIIATFVALSTVAASANSPTNAELKIGITQEFENLNPLIGSMAATSYLSYMVNRGMVFLDATGKWSPQLAKSIPTIENGGAKFVQNGKERGLEVTWEIIDAAKWGDGTPVTCEDFKFAWEVGKNENVSVGSREAYANIKSITWDAKTPKKCVYTYAKAKYDYFQGVPGPLAKHIEEPVFKKFGSKKEGYDQNSNFNKNPTNPGLYNGPYVVSELKLGSHVSFSVNPNFYGKKPAIQKVIVKLIPNTATLEANLRSGTIDMVSSLGFQFDQALAFEKRVKADNLPFRVLFEPGATYEHIDLNLDHPALADVNVRRALVHAINRDELVQALFESRQKAAIHQLSPIDPHFTADPKVVKLYPFSRREASRLLDAAGWKMNEKDGIRYKDGKKLSLQFMTTAGNKTRETVQTLLQSQWKSVGVDVQIKNEPARVFFGETTKKRNYGAMAMYAWVSIPESSPRSQFHSTNIPTAKNSWSGQNYTGWNNKTVDGLADAFEVEFNANKRKDILHKMITEYTNDVPVIPLFYRSDIGVVPKNLTGFKIPGHMFYETNNIEEWSLGGNLK